jgi:aspartyl-tRNA(Asn)/glutamyl-tRNA(Gln) amidotransferase subunit B
VGSDLFGTKVEVTNLNSFRSLERAIEYEVERMTEAHRSGVTLIQETRGWDEAGGRTVSQRSKEEANDYRYFPEPDLPPLRPSPDWVAELRASLPELPAARRERYVSSLGLSPYDAGVLGAEVSLGDYFDAVVAAGVAPKAAANWVSGEFSRLLNQHAAEGLRARDVALPPEGLAELIEEVEAGRVSASTAKSVLARCFESGEAPRVVILAEGLAQVSDGVVIGEAVDAVLRTETAAVGEYRSGKQQVYGYLVGKVMARLEGKADARLVNEELRRRLDESVGGGSTGESA